MTQNTPWITLALTTLLLATVACSEEDAGEGTLTAVVYGEEFIEDGITAEDMADNWEVTFSSFVVDIQDVTVGSVALPSSDPIDISVGTDGNGHELSSTTASAQAYTDASYVIAQMKVTGTATKDGVTKTFDWEFDHDTHYSGCHIDTTLTEGGTEVFQVTVHADHLFYDSLVAEEPQVVFQALADADLDEDGEITRAELEMTDIGSYDPGSAGDVSTMWEWLVAQSSTVGHVNGEGHCDAHSH